jgi:hypothetical protein
VRTRVLFDACSFYLQNLVDDQKPETYSKACDFIVSRFSWNNAQYEYILNLLLNTFENERFEEVYLHLFDFYMNSASCEGAIPNEQERKALAIRNLKKGSPAKKDGVAVDSYLYLPLTLTDAGGWFDVSSNKIGYAEQKNQGFTKLKALLMVGVVVIIYLEMFVW